LEDTIRENLGDGLAGGDAASTGVGDPFDWSVVCTHIGNASAILLHFVNGPDKISW
jgi:hypothetical protein